MERRPQLSALTPCLPQIHAERAVRCILQGILDCQSSSGSESTFLKEKAAILLPNLLSKQTAARVVIAEISQSATLHEPQGQEEFLNARKLLRASLQEMKDYAAKTGVYLVFTSDKAIHQEVMYMDFFSSQHGKSQVSKSRPQHIVEVICMSSIQCWVLWWYLNVVQMISKTSSWKADRLSTPNISDTKCLLQISQTPDLLYLKKGEHSPVPKKSSFHHSLTVNFRTLQSWSGKRALPGYSWLHLSLQECGRGGEAICEDHDVCHCWRYTSRQADTSRKLIQKAHTED